MTNTSIADFHSKSSSRTKSEHPTGGHHNDAPTIESSSITDHSTLPVNNALPCSPGKQQHVDVGIPSEEISPLKHDDSSCSLDNSTDTIEQQREEGQQKLRELVISGATTGAIDWKSIISLAEDLHRREQRLLSSYKTHNSRAVSTGCNEYTSIGRLNISRKQAFFELRSRRRENVRRQKLESIGSFSVNLLLYDADECTNYCGENRDSKSPSCDNENTNNDDTNQIDIYEDEDAVASIQSLSKTQQDQIDLQKNVPPGDIERRNAEQTIVEGSFLAATSLYTPSHLEDDESSESSHSECSSSTISFGGIEMEKIQSSWDEDDGLITIHEDASVNLW